MQKFNSHTSEAVEGSARHRPKRSRYRSLYIADDDTDACQALSVLFKLEGYQVASTTKAHDFVQTVSRNRPDVILLNFSLNGEPTLPFLRRLKALRLGIPVIMLGNTSDVDLAIQAVHDGALSVHVKPFAAEKLVNCVTNALAHDVHVRALPDGKVELEISGFDALTVREREVLQLIANGNSNKEAAVALGISHRTVEVHRAHLMEKLCARNQIDLMRILFAGIDRSS